MIGMTTFGANKKTLPLPVAGKRSDDAYTFGMIAAKSGVSAARLLQGVDPPLGRQSVRREKTSDVKKTSRGDRQHCADQNQLEECTFSLSAESPYFVEGFGSFDEFMLPDRCTRGESTPVQIF